MISDSNDYNGHIQYCKITRTNMFWHSLHDVHGMNHMTRFTWHESHDMIYMAWITWHDLHGMNHMAWITWHSAYGTIPAANHLLMSGNSYITVYSTDQLIKLIFRSHNYININSSILLIIKIFSLSWYSISSDIRLHSFSISQNYTLK